jgi:tetratricopeptide (TPR) repeat protein
MRRLADIYFKRERFSEAVEIVEKILRKSPDESTWAMYFTMLMRQGKSDASKTAKDAFARYRRALVYFDKGTEYEMQNKFSLAVSNYRRGLEIYPDEPSVQMKVGSILMYRKNWHSKAEDFIRKAVELDPDNATYRSSLVICLANQGKFNDAYDEAKVAERMDPLSNIFMMRQIAGRIKRGDEFISLIKEAINRDTMRAQPALRYELGLFYDSRGDQEMADKWFGEALQVLMEHVKNFPDDWELYMEMGNCCKRLRLFKEAENAYQAAEQVSGASLKDVYESLVDLYQRSNQPDKTAIYLKKLIKQEPNKIVNYLDLGISYLSRLTKSLRRKSDNI